MRKAHLAMLAAGTAVSVLLGAATAGAQSMPEPRSMPSYQGSARPMQSDIYDNRSRFVNSPTGVQPNARVITAPSREIPGEAPRTAPRAPAPVQAAPAPQAVPAPAPIVPPWVTEPAAQPVTQPVVTAPAAAPTPEPIAPPVVRAQPKPEPIAAAAGPAIPDAQISDRLREILANKQTMERLVPRKHERDAILAMYQTNRNTPVWIAGGAESERARTAAAHLRGIDADGLDPADYALPRLPAGSAEAAADAELRFTIAMLTYARHAMSGRVHFSRVSPNVEYKDQFDAADAANKLATSSNLARTLDGFNPPQPGYKALKAKYAELRNQAAESGPARIENGPVLKYSRDRQGREVLMNDPRVPLLRERLGLAAEPTSAYNRALADAVARFQKARGLPVSGQLNGATVAALNPMGREKQLETVQLNLERWRWMPRDLGRVHVALNIPDYHLRVMNNGSQVWMTRVVVGKPSQATPLLTETMKFITVNPTWNVPQSIIYQELLPVYETSDRAVFEKMGLRVERRANGEIRVFQPSGERNALGRIRFNFPNKFLVYQHDTPEKHYFAHDRRAYSHGCMRVQDPLKYAEVLLSFAAPRGNYTQESLRRMYGDEERQIDFQQHIPVHISYQTAFVDDAGKLQYREDIYGLDSAQSGILKGTDRKVADVAIDRPADPNFKPTGEHVRRLHNVARGGGNPFELFEQLFR